MCRDKSDFLSTNVPFLINLIKDSPILFIWKYVLHVCNGVTRQIINHPPVDFLLRWGERERKIDWICIITLLSPLFIEFCNPRCFWPFNLRVSDKLELIQFDLTLNNVSWLTFDAHQDFITYFIQLRLSGEEIAYF